MNTVYTLGLSNHTVTRFLELLNGCGVNLVADVRHWPYNRTNRQFNRWEIAEQLKKSGISYNFMGHELGGRSRNPEHYVNGVVRYERIEKSELFTLGIERLIKHIEKDRVALVCTEPNPVDCHRTVLVAKNLVNRGVDVVHILEDGTTVGHKEVMFKLVREFDLHYDLFMTDREAIELACLKQGNRIAHRLKNVCLAVESVESIEPVPV